MRARRPRSQDTWIPRLRGNDGAEVAGTTKVGGTPVPRRGTPIPDVPQAPVPDWVDLECAITALVELLEADEQREVAELRKRDWLAEDRAVEEASREFEAGKSTGRPKRELTAAAERLRKSREAAARRNDRVEALARSLPGALYRPVDDADLEREARALALLRERFPEWQAMGCIPSRTITPGAKTDEPIRTRGWTHWHHLFTPRQLLTLGAMSSEASSRPSNKSTYWHQSWGFPVARTTTRAYLDGIHIAQMKRANRYSATKRSTPC